MSKPRTYRHRETGLIGLYTPELAAQFPDLVEYDEGDPKPLAYQPIPTDAIEAVHSTKKAK